MSQVFGASLPTSGEEDVGIPAWADRALPWMASIVFHLGIGLLVLFLAWFVIKTAKILVDEGWPDGVSTTFNDPNMGGAPNPGELNLQTDAAQSKINSITSSDGWAQSDSKNNTSGILEGAVGEQAADAIFRGSDGGQGGGQVGAGGSGPVTPYGTPGGGMGAGPKSSFFGAGGSGVRIVYVIDHSGSLLDNFDYLRDEIKRSVHGLMPVQRFAVVAFAEESEVLGPPTLQRAMADVQRDLDRRLDDLRPQGHNDDTLQPFQDAFQQAFAMKPQLIYFLTDGAFDPKLADVIKKLNADHKVKINTLAFVQEDPRYKQQLGDIAKENGGIYKFVAEKDLGK